MLTPLQHVSFLGRVSSYPRPPPPGVDQYKVSIVGGRGNLLGRRIQGPLLQLHSTQAGLAMLVLRKGKFVIGIKPTGLAPLP